MTNKTSIPETWKRIFSAAEKIWKMKPWNHMSETDIFGIKIPGTKRVYFISVMGSGGEVTAVTAYSGTRALGMFWDLHQTAEDNMTSSFLTGGRVLTIPQLMLDFAEEKTLTTKEITRMKKLGAMPVEEKRWPTLKQFIPGFLPDEPDENALGDAATIFEQCLEIFRYTAEDESYIYPEEDNDDLYLIRELKKGPGTEWKNSFKIVSIEPVKCNIRFSSTDLARLMKYPKKPEILQIDLALLPTPIEDGKTKPYFPFMLLLVNKKSGIISGYEMLSPVPDINRMYESVPQKILGMLLKNNYRPYQVELRSEILIGFLSLLLSKMEINLKETDRMTSMDEAFEGLLEHLEKR
jgi:hypothetical protein